MPAVYFLNESKAHFPFREALLEAIAGFELPVSLFIAFGNANMSRLPEIDGPALLVMVKKDFLAIGPLYELGNSACFSCLHHWISTSGALLELPDLPVGRQEALAAGELLSLALFRSSLRNDFRNSMQAFDLAQKKHSAHPIYPRRDCKTCSRIEISEHLGLRVHCSTLTGIVRKMQITSSQAAGSYRAIAEWASPLPLAQARPLLKAQESYGRGRTREEAEQGCIGEALERYSLIYRGDEPLERARVHDISGIDPREILLYSDRQYESREQWNRMADERYFVGEPFDPEREINWFPGINLTNGARKFLPAGCVLMWYSFHGEPEYARADSVGCGSGRTFDDALLHALLEWIERDAMAIWWYNRIRRPAVNLESFAQQELLEVRNALRRIGRDLFLLDCTTDFAIPTYISIAPRQDGTELLFAGASHPSPRVAAWKAASEVGQLWFSAVHLQAMDMELKNWLKESFDSQPYLLPTHEIQAPAEPPAMSTREQVAWLCTRFEASGLKAYAADLSRPDVVLKAARAIIPGLRHIWNRRAPGRLYDVPVRLGWRHVPLQEEQLNPLCCMI